MKRIVLLSIVALCVFAGLPRIVAACNNARQEHARQDDAAGPFQGQIGFNGFDFADGGRSPFGQ